MKAFLAAFSSQEPRYHRIGSEDWDDAERGGVPQTIQWRRNCFTVRLAGCTLKGALGFVGSMALLMLLAFAGVCVESSHLDSPGMAGKGVNGRNLYETDWRHRAVMNLHIPVGSWKSRWKWNSLASHHRQTRTPAISS